MKCMNDAGVDLRDYARGDALSKSKDEANGKSWVHRDPLQKIKILSGSRMRELVRVLSEV